MFNVTIFKLKDLIKYLLFLTIIITAVLYTTKIFSNMKQASEENTINPERSEKDIKDMNDHSKKISYFNYDLTSCINETSSLIKEINKMDDGKPQAHESNFFEDIIDSQVGLVKGIDKTKNDVESDLEGEDIQITSTDLNLNQEENKQVETNLKTEVVTPNPIQLNYNFEYGKVKIKNQTSFELNNDIVSPNINIDNKNILLFHTHTCESYTSSDSFSYTPTGTFRTTDLNFTVARVGDELEKNLKQYGYNVIHNKDYHDYPSYNGSYTNSLNTVENILKTNKSDIIFDIHRDAVGSKSDYAPSVKIGDNDVCAQIMFVIGTNEGGLWHPNWNQNLKFAVKVQEKAEEMYPGLFKPIMLTKYRYNQHTGKYASIIEVGATGNTMEQCLNSMKYLSKVLDEVLKSEN